MNISKHALPHEIEFNMKHFIFIQNSKEMFDCAVLCLFSFPDDSK